MTDAPGADPNHPPYGWGSGLSAEAEGTAAFAVPPEPQLDVVTDSRFTRRQRRTNRQEQGFDPAYAAGYPGRAAEPAAAHDVAPVAGSTPFSGQPDAVIPPDDQNTAVPRVTQ